MSMLSDNLKDKALLIFGWWGGCVELLCKGDAIRGVLPRADVLLFHLTTEFRGDEESWNLRCFFKGESPTRHPRMVATLGLSPASESGAGGAGGFSRGDIWGKAPHLVWLWVELEPLSDPGEVVQHPGSHKWEKRGLKTLWKLALGQLLFQPQFLGMGFVIKDMSLQLNGIKVNAAEGWPEVMLLLKSPILGWALRQCLELCWKQLEATVAITGSPYSPSVCKAGLWRQWMLSVEELTKLNVQKICAAEWETHIQCMQLLPWRAQLQTQEGGVPAEHRAQQWCQDFAMFGSG